MRDGFSGLTIGLAALTALGMAGPLQAAPAPGPVTAIVDATVFDGTGAAPRVATVIIRDGRIAEVGPGLKPPRGAVVVPAKGKALLPGFFDLHTHWTPGGAPAVAPRIAAAYVAAGVTTVNDFHQPPEAYAPRRRWLDGLTTPHVNFTARMSTPGGHGADWADVATTKWVSTAEAARAEVRALLPYKPDAIKAFADGWRYGSSPDNTSMDYWTLSALADEAHKAGLKVLTHTVTVDRGKVAARAKVDVIAHSLQDREVDDEVVALMKANGTVYAPTLAVYEPVKPGQPPPANRDDPRVQQSFRKFGYALHNVKALHDAGVPIAVGTDAGMPGTPHGAATLREMELLVQAGLTPAEALMAGTANGARAMNAIADRGTIEKGKRADLVLVAGEPWANISDIRKTERVFIDGRPVFGPGAKPTPADGQTSMPAIKVAALIDDFEGAPGRTRLDTLRLDDMDGGHDRTVQVSQVAVRQGRDHALLLAARMATKEAPSAGVILPLSRGSVEPVDARGFKGIRFDVRGDGGPYAVTVNTQSGRWRAPVTADAEWTTVEIPFSSLTRAPGRGGDAPWTGADLLDVGFSGGRAAGERLWLQIDNVSFF
ncbi:MULTISPECIES: CIA30 family protein [unclassified Phenylobacterium]|uniref:CIA30 family protein n=1 Tax=unclassified Phenylobacterium TaxID=2640670 RepID=UPI00083B3277|nr:MULTISPECIES: CIA30 family protein [unclassified Phenylobacterium]